MYLRRRWASAAAAVVCAAAMACAPQAAPEVAIQVSAERALADEAVRVRVSGLQPGAEVTISAKAVDATSQVWHAEATFVADTRGVVELDRDEPTSGSYDGVDAMGLFSYMEPVLGDGEQSRFTPRSPEEAGTYEVVLSAKVGGAVVARASTWRVFGAQGVAHRAVELVADGVIGDLFLPPPGSPRRPCVLIFGGSDGGVGMKLEAAVLASRGYPALALGYVGLPGLAETVRDVPIEYFAAGARLLASQSAADPESLVVVGYSRGSEAALLLANGFPNLVAATVVYAPTAQVWPSYPPGGAAWTLQGRPVHEGPIPLDRVDGPVLAVAGTQDAVWAAGESAREIERRLADAAAPAKALIFEEAGHGVGTLPYRPSRTSAFDPIAAKMVELGGSEAGNEAARRQGWQEVLTLLSDLAVGGTP